MCTILSALTAGAGLYSGVAQANAVRAQGDAQAAALRANANIATEQGHDAIERGGQDELRLRRNIARNLANQRVQAAASGVDINSGSVIDARDASISEGEHDAAAIRFNAARERWGYQTQAANLNTQANSIQAQSRSAADNMLFGSVLNFGLDLGQGIYDGTYKSSPLTETTGDYNKYWEPPNWNNAYWLARKSYEANKRR